MKRDKFNGKGAEECSAVDWSKYSDEVTIGDQPSKRKDEFDWDFNNVKTDYTVKFDESGRQIDNTGRISITSEDEIGENIVSETLVQIASEDVYKADGAFVTGEIDARKVNKAIRTSNAIDERSIRQSVDDKIIIKSRELKDKRNADEAKKVKIRVKKDSVKNEKNDIPSKKNHSKKAERSEKSSKSASGKYKNLGTIPSGRKEPSKFRRESAKWRYDSVPKAAVTDEAIDKAIDQAVTNETLIDKIKNFGLVSYICVAMAVVILVTSVLTTAVYANYKGELNKAQAFAKLPQFVDSDSVAYGSYAEEEYEDEDAATQMEEIEHRILSLVLSSVEKDLKIKLIDDEDNLVKDIPWGVTVTDSEGDESVYEDDDQDGVIHLEDVSAGDYMVSIVPSEYLSGYILPSMAQEVNVKAKIEYKVIANIKEEIKKESEVNVALEDPNGGKGADVETGTALKDTVNWVESSEVSQGEDYEEAEVDLSKTEQLVAFVDRMISAVKSIAARTRMIFDRNSVVAINGITLIADKDDEETSDDDTSSSKTDDGDGAIKSDEESDEDSDEGSDSETLQPVVKDKTVKTATINKASASMNIGESMQLSLTYAPEGTVPASVAWKSTNEEIVGVSDTGKITAKKSGNAQAVAIINGAILVYCDVTVKETGDEITDASVVLAGPSTISKDSTATIEATCSQQGEIIAEWTSSDEKIATVTPNGNLATVKGLSIGTVRIQAVSQTGIKSYIDIEVTESTGYADDAQLYDSSKNKLYVCDNSNYRLAKYSDYKSGAFTKFYRKIADVVYTGWQTIDGFTYYFTENHEKVTGDQVIGGVTYHFGEDGTLSQGSGTLGIDVSKYQPTINWNSVKASGVNYVIIRCGYRGASTGALIQDPCFYSHIKGAKAAGLKVGIYFFSTALNETEAVEEASMCAALCEGYGINYPVFIDVEPSSRAGYNGLSRDARTANIRAFCSTIQSAGYTPGLYANKTWLSEMINTSSLSCKIWLAQYNASGPTYSGHYDLWQYTSKGHVDGISGNVDMNQSYLGY